MKTAAAFTLAAALAAAGTASAGGDHTASVKLKTNTSPHTMILTAHHRSCQKNPKLKDATIEVQALVYNTDGIPHIKEQELLGQYEKIVTPLFRDRNDITRADIQSTLQKFMKDTAASTHFEFRGAIVDFLPVNKSTDPCRTVAKPSP